MDKAKAISLLGGTISAAAEAIGVSYQAVDKWPDPLPRRIADRVLAAQARKHLPPELIGADGVPVLRMNVIHDVTGGAVPFEETLPERLPLQEMRDAA